MFCWYKVKFALWARYGILRDDFNQKMDFR